MRFAISLFTFFFMMNTRKTLTYHEIPFLNLHKLCKDISSTPIFNFLRELQTLSKILANYVVADFSHNISTLIYMQPETIAKV